MKKVFSLLLVAVLGFVLVGCGSETKTDKKKEEKKDYTIGETASVDDIKITVNSTRNDAGIFAPEEGTVYFVLDITLENTGDEDFTSSSMMSFKLKDADGREQDLSIGANLNGSMDTDVPAGEKASGEIAFETAPEGQLVLTYTPGFGDKVKINVR